MPAGNVNRSDTEQALAIHEKRIRDLEWARSDALEVTDGSTDVVPTTKIVTGGDLVLTDLGGGAVEIEAFVPPLSLDKVACKFDHTNVGGLAGNAPIPLTVLDNQGFNVTNAAIGQVIINTTGIYLLNVWAMIVSLSGIGGAREVLILDSGVSKAWGSAFISPGFFVQETVHNDDGQIYRSINLLLQMDAGEYIKMGVGNLSAQDVRAAGQVSLFRVP